MVIVIRSDDTSIIHIKVEIVQVPQEERVMTRSKVSNPNIVIHLRVVNRALVGGVHLTLVLPRVDMDLVPVSKEHVFVVVSLAIDQWSVL